MAVANGTARLFQVLKALSGPGELPAVAGDALAAVLEAVSATTGAIYVVDREREPAVVRRVAARNLSPDAPATFLIGQGLVGECAQHGERRVVSLPPDPAFVTRTFLGDIAPRALVVCPLALQDGLVAGVLAVASMAELDAQALEALDQLASPLASAIVTALALRERDRTASYYGRILSDVDAAVIATDRDGAVTIWNRAAERLFALPAEEALGAPVRDLVVAREREPLRDALAAVFEGRRTATLDELAVDTRTGGSRLVRLRISPLTDDEGQLSGAIIIGVDVTDERRRLDELAGQKLAVESLNAALRRQARALAERQHELEQKNELVAAADRSKSEFIANMSHELRTPLNSIRGFCRLLLDPDRNISDGDRREFLDIIDRNGRELLALIDDILDLAKADAGHLSAERSRVDLVELAREIASELDPLAREKGITIEVVVEGEAPSLETDDAKLRRILRNLVANAVKFTHQGGVTIRVRSRESGASISVADTGIGIAARDQRRIFEPFVQVDGSNARRYGGTGLGLSIVQRLAMILGATVSLESEPERGSNFTLLLPGSAPAPPAVRPVSAPVREELTELVPVRPRAAFRVVVAAIADEQARSELARALGALDLHAVHAPIESVPALARELTREGRLAAVALDATPAGFDAVEALRSDGATLETPLFLVADEEPGSAYLGAATVIRRSCGPDELAARIAEAASHPPRARPAAARALDGKKILIVEDNEDSARLAKLLIEERGGSVTLAPDAGQALAFLRSSEPDAVIMDLMLPGLDGYEATRAIRQMSRGARLPVVAATAAVLPGDRARALEAGCDDIVAKPYDADELTARVAAAIEAREAPGARDAARPQSARSPASSEAGERT